MFSHVMLGTDDMPASRAFYDAVMPVLGVSPGREDAKGRVVYMGGGTMFMLSRPINGEPACHANGGTVGFRCTSEAQLREWHAAGLAHGGTAIEDPPGERQTPFGPLVLAYLRDPAGNKLCAAYRPA
ncbi:catechol 2,3-dioxygenase-like lactoylglutathione lyase family enzyme [Sphingomonas jejuensis]|uniref:Catechol 2,3-dioxygenase-like lactoylglutathione lyase family enzyme n=1 Tax=Sphingomonas jejuensis TaxID=904715 RepID=A0ABX0XMU5_9SPHN|nr:VOC family protein [Sphingomonas jejuensis]NJC34067.1 catechol 2,3-dioxygenase-like lactoylglutathione lyase family enzyme [Sphingomonas jejuensis]